MGQAAGDGHARKPYSERRQLQAGGGGGGGGLTPLLTAGGSPPGSAMNRPAKKHAMQSARTDRVLCP